MSPFIGDMNLYSLVSKVYPLPTSDFQVAPAALRLSSVRTLPSFRCPSALSLCPQNSSFISHCILPSPPPKVPTPHIDAIANNGLKLMNYHVQPVCSPTRSTFMSGRHVIHTGLFSPFPQGTALRLNLSYTCVLSRYQTTTRSLLDHC